MEKLVLVHLSDLDFTRVSGVSVHDLDKHERNDMVPGDSRSPVARSSTNTPATGLRDFCEAIGCRTGTRPRTIKGEPS